MFIYPAKRATSFRNPKVHLDLQGVFSESSEKINDANQSKAFYKQKKEITNLTKVIFPSGWFHVDVEKRKRKQRILEP